MSLNLLLEKLIEIERSIGKESQIALQRRVIDAQECVLAIQQQMASQGRARVADLADSFSLQSWFSSETVD